MTPTLRDGDVLAVANGARGVGRGSLVLFRLPGGGQKDAQVKRVVGMPGDTIVFESGSLLVNGELFPEPYLNGLPQTVELARQEWRLGPGEMFALGDNRAHSDDSRTHGPVPFSAIVGVAELRLWPVTRIGRLAPCKRGGR